MLQDKFLTETRELDGILYNLRSLPSLNFTAGYRCMYGVYSFYITVLVFDQPQGQLSLAMPPLLRTTSIAALHLASGLITMLISYHIA